MPGKLKDYCDVLKVKVMSFAKASSFLHDMVRRKKKFRLWTECVQAFLQNICKLALTGGPIL